MEQNAEVVYLKNRRGFVRMAIQHGAGVQTSASHRLSRKAMSLLP